MKLSASTLALSGHSFAVACEAIADCGYDYVEPAYIEGYAEFTEADLSPANGAELKRIAADHGLESRSVSAHVDMGAGDAFARMMARIDFADSLGARFLITNAGSTGSDAIFASNLERIAPEAAARGIIICVENPGTAGSLFPDGEAMAAWKARLDHPSIDINYDVGNIFTASNEAIDPAEDISASAGFGHFHIKDLRSDTDGWHMCAIGKGAIDYHQLLGKLALLRPGAVMTVEMPLRLWRPGRGAPKLKPVFSIEAIRGELIASREFIVRHFRPDSLPTTLTGADYVPHD